MDSIHWMIGDRIQFENRKLRIENWEFEQRTAHSLALSLAVIFGDNERQASLSSCKGNLSPFKQANLQGIKLWRNLRKRERESNFLCTPFALSE